MRIVVLTKPVPDPASAGERLGPDGRLDRAAVPAVVNGNDEYALEAALKLIEAARRRGHAALDGAGERARDDAQGPRDGRDAGRPGHRPGARRAPARCRRRRSSPRRSRRSSSTSSLAGVDTSDGVAGVVARGRRRTQRPAVPLLRREDRARRGGRDRPRPADHPDRLRRPRGADAGPDHRAPRRSASRATRRSRGSWRARSKEIVTLSLADLGLDAVDGRRRRRDDEGRRLAAAEARAATRVVREPRRRGRPPDRRVPRRAEAHLMARVLGRRRGRRRTARSRSSRPRSRRSPGASPRQAAASWQASCIGAAAAGAAKELAAFRAAGLAVDGAGRRRSPRPRRSPPRCSTAVDAGDLVLFAAPAPTAATSRARCRPHRHGASSPTRPASAGRRMAPSSR